MYYRRNYIVCCVYSRAASAARYIEFRVSTKEAVEHRGIRYNYKCVISRTRVTIIACDLRARFFKDYVNTFKKEKKTPIITLY